MWARASLLQDVHALAHISQVERFVEAAQASGAHSRILLQVSRYSKLSGSSFWALW